MKTIPSHVVCNARGRPDAGCRVMNIHCRVCHRIMPTRCGVVRAIWDAGLFMDGALWTVCPQCADASRQAVRHD